MFEIKIVNQYWIDENPANTTDLCSHGEIFLEINGLNILNRDDGDWSISTSALQLLRSVINDHTIDKDRPLILHCGMLLMVGCPIRVDWKVNHINNITKIEQVQKLLTTNEQNLIKYNEANVEVERKEYAQKIIKFSDDVYNFFQHTPARAFDSEYEKRDFQEFWSEFNALRKKIQIEFLGQKAF